MLFYQKHTYNEYQFGQQTVMFAVSDSYSEIFSLSEGVETDIFSVGSLKQDLNLSESKFAIDELDFSINQASCKTDNDRNALAFTLECKDKFRVCAVFFIKGSEAPNNDNLLFLGSLSNKVSGDDLYWSSLPFGTLINPIREYKFSALSLDISLLEKCLMTEKCYNQNSVQIANIYERIPEVFLRAINIPEQFSFIAYPLQPGQWSLYNTCKLSAAIELYLTRAEILINEMYGINVKFKLAVSDLGIQVSPTEYVFQDSPLILKEQKASNNSLYNLWLKADSESIKEPWINTRMVAPGIKFGSSEQVSYDDKEIIADEKQFSFKSFKSVSELLFGIARALNCYLTSYYTVDENGILNINIEYKSKLNLTETNNTFIVGASDASFDTAGNVSDKNFKYYTQANQYTVDDASAIDVIVDGSNFDWQKSKAIDDEKKKRDAEKDKYKTEFDILCLSTSQTLFNYNKINRPMPINTFPPSDYTSYDNFYTNIIFTNALYIHCKVPEQQQRDMINNQNLGITDCIRPIAKVYATVNGEVLKDDTGEGVSLVDYVNYSIGHEKTYYETEYELTVPYWNGFSKTSNGANCKWQNAKLGSKIVLNEDIRVFADGEWRIFRPAEGTVFVVVGKEVSLSGIETKLKLQNTNRFAYNIYYSGKEGEFLAPNTSIIWAKADTFEKELRSQYKSAEIKAGEIILIGDAVMIEKETGQAFKAVAKSEYYGRVKGIAKEIVDNICYYHDNGIIECDAYNFDTEKLVFVRTAPDSNSLNISQNFLNSRNGAEDLAIWLGEPKTEKSFNFKFKNMVVE